MWLAIILSLLGVLFGWVLGMKIPITLPEEYTLYLGLAVLAALDSIFGGIRAWIEGIFDNKIFLTGFFSNILLAAGLAYLGEQLGIALSIAAVVAFGVRLFHNLAFIRRHILEKLWPS
ncbi:small basic family protein [Peptococcaceae bacterium]|nr:small basic family protein [Peptococcaceae bacterium]